MIEGGNTRLRKEEEPGVRVQKPEELEVYTGTEFYFSQKCIPAPYQSSHIHASMCNVCVYVHIIYLQDTASGSLATVELRLLRRLLARHQVEKG